MQSFTVIFIIITDTGKRARPLKGQGRQLGDPELTEPDSDDDSLLGDDPPEYSTTQALGKPSRPAKCSQYDKQSNKLPGENNLLSSLYQACTSCRGINIARFTLN